MQIHLGMRNKNYRNRTRFEKVIKAIGIMYWLSNVCDRKSNTVCCSVYIIVSNPILTSSEELLEITV